MDGASETPRGAELSSLPVEPLDGLFELAGPPEPVGEARYSHELFDLVVRFQQHDAATEQRDGYIVRNENPDGEAVSIGDPFEIEHRLDVLRPNELSESVLQQVRGLSIYYPAAHAHHRDRTFGFDLDIHGASR